MCKMTESKDFKSFFQNVVFFPDLVLLALCLLYKSHIWENSRSRVVSQSVLSKSDCRILKSAISQKKMNKLDLWHVDKD